MLGSSQCKHCSNIHLLIILPLAASGITLVIILFFFNLTVTNSNISTVIDILHVNIININSLVFFPKHHSLVYVLTSLLNVDLGIETCFCKRMDGYGKSWLQLVYPLYLLMLVILLVISSRRSIRIQRLTACRVLPVASY